MKASSVQGFIALAKPDGNGKWDVEETAFGGTGVKASSIQGIYGIVEPDGLGGWNIVSDFGGGGGLSNFKGSHATPSALILAYPTAAGGDYAIVQSTNSLWIWNINTLAWQDTNATTDVNYTQAFAGVTSVVVTHNLGKFPDTSILDGSGRELLADVTHNSTNQLAINFLVPTTGTVICN